jgi:hypothetical protein
MRCRTNLQPTEELNFDMQSIWRDFLGHGVKKSTEGTSDIEYSEELPYPLTAETLQQATVELSPAAQVALQSCIGAWQVYQSPISKEYVHMDLFTPDIDCRHAVLKLKNFLNSQPRLPTKARLFLMFCVIPQL